ncbi:antibiotic biosynthesis monooxygenase [Niallia circulans]|uniref:Antibiotic biosynthesis monooxygenase n=1 Tax=Niallia circulans TaxID=1397 RepID=A0A553SME3_NIACI|nr:antibiotic biosynthesis monooxygenase [Niallia circulans]TRZ38161.1 antibiotic biosynthesis monooxygenase [Niallia circulans]
MILEAAMLQVREGMEQSFEQAIKDASQIIGSMEGYIEHELQSCLEAKGKYLLLVRWKELEDHTIGFRQSAEYEQWKKLLHHFYEPFPTVEHFTKVYPT